MRTSLGLLAMSACLLVGLTTSAIAIAQPLDARQEARQLGLESRQWARSSSLPGTRLLSSLQLTRVVVGLSDASDVKRVARRLRAAGASVERFPALSAIASSGLAAATVIQLLRGDTSVTFIEEDRQLAPLADTYDALDPETGLNFHWAYEAIAAGPGIAAVGGGSQFTVAVIDTGVDAAHPDLAGRIVGSYSAVDGGADVTDELGHGTFVAGLIAAIDGNGIGGKGAAGATNLLAVRASTPGGEFYESQLADSIVWATQAGAKVINLSLGGPCPPSDLVTSALDHAFAQGALVVAAAGNSAEFGNEPNCPAAELGGLQGDWGTGLSVAATRPDGQRAAFSTFNDNISVAAPGGSGSDCRYGVFSTIPSAVNLWDGSCSNILAPPEAAPARWAYGEGTSFAAPLVSAVAVLALQANPNLLPEQVARVLATSAQQSVGEGWNAQTGSGIVNAATAVELARRFDTLEPQVQTTTKPGPKRIALAFNATEVAREGEDVAGGVSVTVERSRDGVSFEPWLHERAAPLARKLKASRTGPAYWFRAVVCDANRNCSVTTVGPKRPQRIRPKVTLRTRQLADGRGRAIVTLKRVKGFRGRAKVVLERRVKGRYRAIHRFRLGFGKTVARSIKLDLEQPFRLRARVRSTADWRCVRSRAISIAAPGRP